MKLDSISFLKDATNIEIFEKGYSGASKYLFEKNGTRYFLKIGKFEIDNNLENLLIKSGISHPAIIEFEKFDDEYNYIIEEYIDGKNLKEELNKYDSKYIYEYGFKMGEKYRNLRKVYPDKPMTKDIMEKHLSSVNKRIKKLQDLIKNNDKISENELDFIDYIIDYLEKNIDLIENSSLVFGHTDIKPSNFLIYNRNIIATDIEDTDYKELSFSMRWSFARNDYNDEKNLAFTRGYLDGLFNLDIPEKILACFNYTYFYGMLGYCIHYIEKGEFHKITRLFNHIKENYMMDNELKISEKLKSHISINSFPELTGYDITLISGSYNPNNLTFKCTNNKNNYFFKIMRMSDFHFKKSLNSYKILDECNIPISQLKYSGVCEYDKYYYIINEFIDHPEMNKDKEINTFEEGFKYGKLVAEYLKNLKEHKSNDMKVFSKENLYNDVINCIEDIYGIDESCEYIIWTKREIIAYIDHYIKAFDDEPIDLIHGDVKFGNILHDGENKIYFVDNENLMYSYDIINFLYNIHIGFLENNVLCYRGFVNGYLKYMNNGNIPLRIHNQAKLLLIYYLLRITRNVLNEKGDENNIQYVLSSCKKYIGKDNKVEWLK